MARRWGRAADIPQLEEALAVARERLMIAKAAA
jgi:hypothetical protein